MSWLGIDAGTSSVKALLIDDAQAVLAEASAPLEVQRPQPLWSEQDPADWWRATEIAVAQVRAAAPGAWAGLDGIGLSGQMHGAVLLDAAALAALARQLPERLDRAPPFCGTTDAPGRSAWSWNSAYRTSAPARAIGQCRASRRRSCCGCSGMSRTYSPGSARCCCPRTTCGCA